MIKHKIRDSKGNTVEVELSRGKAIKLFCYECMCWVKAEVRNRTAPLCPLYPFRPLKRENEKPHKSGLNSGKVRRS
jgi:hypothetical protein